MHSNDSIEDLTHRWTGSRIHIVSWTALVSGALPRARNPRSQAVSRGGFHRDPI